MENDINSEYLSNIIFEWTSMKWLKQEKNGH